MTTPPALAVMVTGVVVVVPVVTAVNVAELLLTATLTDVGTATNDVLPFTIDTLNVPETAFELSVTVQVLGWPPTTVDGEQETPVNATVGCTMVTVEPELVLVIRPPVAELAIPLVSCKFDEVSGVAPEIVNVTVATTPLAIGVSFSP